jgi:hypothetical protein
MIYKNDIYYVTCHTSIGNVNDEHGRFFEAGKKYKLHIERINPSKDTNYKECILCWVDFNDNFGSRFSLVGNIYQSDKPYWNHLTDCFYDPVQEDRICKIEDLEI